MLKCSLLLLVASTAAFVATETDCYGEPLRTANEWYRDDINAQTLVIKSNVHAVVYTKTDSELGNIKVETNFYAAKGATGEVTYDMDTMNMTVEGRGGESSGAASPHSPHKGMFAMAGAVMLAVFSLRSSPSQASFAVLFVIGLAMATMVESADGDVNCATFGTKSRVVIVVTFPTTGNRTQDRVPIDVSGLPKGSIISEDSQACADCGDDTECSFAVTGRLTCVDKGSIDFIVPSAGLVSFSWLNQICLDTSNPPTAPTDAEGIVVFAHGWQPDGQGKKTKPCLPLSNEAFASTEVSPWVKNGWHVGHVHWERFAGESDVKDSEAMIWSPNAKPKMRFILSVGSDERRPSSRERPLKDLIWEKVLPAIMDAANSGVRVIFVGHSLGSQVISHLAYKYVTDPRIKSSRKLRFDLWLLDPFFSMGEKDYLSNYQVGDVVRDGLIPTIQAKGGRVHWTQTAGTNGTLLTGDNNLNNDTVIDTVISLYGAGDPNDDLKRKVMFTDLKPLFSNELDDSEKHTSAYVLFFLSWSGYGNGTNPDAQSEPSTTVEKSCWYQEDSGADTVRTDDDSFSGGIGYTWHQKPSQSWPSCQK